MRAAVLLAAFLLAVPAVAQAPAGFQPQEEDVTSFPDFPGRDEAFGFCSACHAFRLVANQGMTREQWDGSLTWMTDRHAMPELEGEERKIILDYLAAAFPPREPAGGRGGWRNPFQPQ